MRLLSFIFLLFCLSLASEIRAESSATLLAKGIQLLQDNKKSEALRTLERAFEQSNEPNELRVIGSLILEASPLDYPKRDAYLRYLVKFSPEHEDYPRWLRELGDRALNTGNLDQAEDWYLRSQVFFKSKDEKAKVEYKLAWVYWNKKQREKTMQSFLDLYTDQPEMREILRPDLARVWWEIQSPSASSLTKLKALAEDERKLIVIEVSSQSKAKSKDVLASFLKSAREVSWLKKDLIEQISAGWRLEKQECLFFDELLEPKDTYPEALLLDCARSRSTKKPEALLSYFEEFSGVASEKFRWAHIDLLVQAGDRKKAASLALQTAQNKESSPEFSTFVENLLLSLSQEEFSNLYAETDRRDFESFLRRQPDSKLLLSLQTFKPEHWIRFQEQEQPESLDKEFWIRKAAWQSSKNPDSLDDLRYSLEKILSFELNPTEAAVRDKLQLLHARSSTQLPSEFGESFRKEYDRWIADLDQAIKVIQGAGEQWNQIALAFLRLELEKNLSALKAQLQNLQLPPDAQDLATSFEQRKKSLMSDLDKKYSGLLARGK